MIITYCEADYADIDGMVLLLKQLFSIERDFTFNETLHRRGLDQLMHSANSFLLVAKYESFLIGMCTMQCRISTASGALCGIVEDVIVDRQYRGEGIGRELLRRLEEKALSSGLTSLQLAADKGNKRAFGFYTKNGWETTNLVYLRKNIS